MTDARLRDAEREAERHPDDVSVGHAWLAAADRAGDAAHATRALGHLARLGDAAGYDELRARVPWPHGEGHGDSRWLPVSTLDDPLLSTLEAPRLEGHCVLAADRERVLELELSLAVLRSAGARRWEAPRSPGVAWLTPAAAIFLDGDRLTLRRLETGAVLHTIPAPTTWKERVSIEADRALLAADGGGAVCVDLVAQPGLVLWDTRVAAPAAPRARVYDPAGSFQLGDVVSHPKFGEGPVSRVDARKVTIAFADGERALAHAGRKAAALPPAAVVLDRPCRRALLVASVALLEDDRRVTALDARTGAFLWATERPAKLACADARGVVLQQNVDPRGRATTWSLVELDPRTGRERWFFPSSGVACLALGERLGLALRTKTKGWVDREAERELVALERDSGSVRWRRSPWSSQLVAVTRAHVLLMDHDEDDRRMRGALDLETGAELQRSHER